MIKTVKVVIYGLAIYRPCKFAAYYQLFSSHYISSKNNIMARLALLKKHGLIKKEYYIE